MGTLTPLVGMQMAVTKDNLAKISMLQYSCLENPMDRGTSWATVHGVAESWTRLKRLSIHAGDLAVLDS